MEWMLISRKYPQLAIPILEDKEQYMSNTKAYLTWQEKGMIPQPIRCFETSVNTIVMKYRTSVHKHNISLNTSQSHVTVPRKI